MKEEIERLSIEVGKLKAMLLRASKDHKHGVAFRGHCGDPDPPESALSHGAKRNKGGQRERRI